MRRIPQWDAEAEIRVLVRQYEKLQRNPRPTLKERQLLRALPEKIFWEATKAGLPNPLQTAAGAPQ